MTGTIENMTDSFSNPFDEINANVIDFKKIVEYWCDPFESGLLSNINEQNFRLSKIPVILQGSRGCGKTTILKYFSFPAQVERSILNKEKSVLNRIKDEKEVGFYFRCEESFISTFIAIFRNVSPDNWSKFFECYIELIFAQKILDMLFTLKDRGEIKALPNDVVKSILLNYVTDQQQDNLDMKDLYDLLHQGVVYFEQYKNRILFTNEKFEPSIFVGIFSISENIITNIKSTIPEFKDVIFLLMIDEFENLNQDLQRLFNTIIKFVKPDISIRIGRRSEGKFTTGTVNDIEYLSENHDYCLAKVGNEQKINLLKKYFSKVASLRFRKTDYLQLEGESTDISSMLGVKEDLLKECRAICDNRKLHVEYVLKQVDKLAADENLRRTIINIIKNDDNPIAETLNALWVIRAKSGDYKSEAIYAAKTMHAYFSDQESAGVKKYKNDYNNKYRRAIAIYICYAYKKEKKYYSFNTLSHLSNGNIRTFINLCQSIINYAMFYEKNSFVKTGKISELAQNRAIRNFSKSEFDDICSVVYAGDKIRRFVLNLGNALSEYHKDKKIRYPETTQFTFDETLLYPEDAEILHTAESWSIIIKKEKVQRASAGIKERKELYYMNKMFTPLFNISYGTRGGVNLRLGQGDIHNLLHDDSYYPKCVVRLLSGKAGEVLEMLPEMSLFDLRPENE